MNKSLYKKEKQIIRIHCFLNKIYNKITQKIIKIYKLPMKMAKFANSMKI